MILLIIGVGMLNFLLPAHLNSIMFLLIPLAYSCNYHCRNALNSIMFLLIPQKWRIYEQSNANFKFHYVSINSTTAFKGIIEFISFKFHYVSINSKEHVNYKRCIDHFKFHYVSINSRR